MAEIQPDVDECMYYLTASLVTLLAVLIVVRFSQRTGLKLTSHHTVKEGQDYLQEQAGKGDGEEEEEELGDSDIDDLLIKPEEIEEISGSPVLTDDSPEDDNDFRCESLQGKLKQARHKKIKEKLEGDMTERQINAESETRTSQLEAIFKLMEQSKDTFGIESMNDVQDQLKLYAIN